MKFSRITLASFATLTFFFGFLASPKLHCVAAGPVIGEDKTSIPDSNLKEKTSSIRGRRIAQTISDSKLDHNKNEENQGHRIVHVRSLEEEEGNYIELLTPLGTNSSNASSYLFEGDIVADYDFIMENYGTDLAKDLVAEGLLGEPLHNDTFSLQSLHTNSLWKTRVNDIVEVPYSISSQYDSRDRNDINTALKELGDTSKVVKFVPRRSESSYISVIPERGCWSHVGKIGGRQNLSLASRGCFRKGTIQHEFMHAIGMSHEQSRPDRDRYVTINWGNIEGGKDSNFHKRTSSKTLGNPYDYGSVMHYGKTAFSKNGRDTITTKNGASIGNRVGASNQDIIDMRLMYQCASGARTLSQYNANRCTSDCKCWEGERGCNSNNNACQGSLVCSSNRCVRGGGGGGGGGGSSGFSRKFMLINPKSGKALDVNGAKCDDRTNIHLYKRNNSGAQIFHYHYTSRAIVNVKCNKAVDIDAAKCNNGANIQLYRRNGTGAQQFRFLSNGRIESVGCVGKSIDIYRGLSDNRTNIQSWSKHGGDNQKWQIVYV